MEIDHHVSVFKPFGTSRLVLPFQHAGYGEIKASRSFCVNGIRDFDPSICDVSLVTFGE
jgi:hypothetical protein